MGHCRSKESKAQVQEPQQSKVSKKLRTSTEARSRRGSLKARRNLKQDKLSQKACKSKEIVRSCQSSNQQEPFPFFCSRFRRQVINLLFETSCNVCMQL